MYNFYRSTLTSKGQATIPAPLRKVIGIKPGQKILFESGENQIIIRKATPLEELMGSLKPKVKVKYTDKMANEAIGKFLGEEYLRKYGKNR